VKIRGDINDINEPLCSAPIVADHFGARLIYEFNTGPGLLFKANDNQHQVHFRSP
jgi:hypothetical protein